MSVAEERKTWTDQCIIEPTPGHCVVIRDGFHYSGTIIIPDNAKQQPTTGYIVAVGDQDRMNLVGRRIVWGRYSGMPVAFSGRPVYDILLYEEILGYLLDDNAKLDMDNKSPMNRE